ncbi:MAG: hypothetical protein IJD00_06100 [Clostridia bacterium]|nr:hypothetical protein [Clostridia bacterium]
MVEKNKFEKILSNINIVFGEVNKVSPRYMKDAQKLEKILCQALKSLPKNCRETEQYKNTVKLEKTNYISIENLFWLEKECWKDKSIFDLEKEILKVNIRCDLIEYICFIISDKNIGIREKVIVLLSHFEPLLFLAFNIKKKKGDKIKNVAKTKEEKINELSTENIGLIILIAITRVVFANTDNFDRSKPIDRRLPFRNNILHNGILDYDEEDVMTVYKVLLSFILKIFQIIKRFSKIII